jgi:hypothetical protein
VLPGLSFPAPNALVSLFQEQARAANARADLFEERFEHQSHEMAELRLINEDYGDSCNNPYTRTLSSVAFSG